MNPKELKILLQARNEMQAAFKQAGGQIDSLVVKQQRQAEMTRKVGAAFAAGGAVIAAAGSQRGQGLGRCHEDNCCGDRGCRREVRKLAGEHTGGWPAQVGACPEAATNIADLNTHLGLMGPELETVAIAAHKAGINTNSFGAFARQMGLDAAGSVSVLDQLSKVADDTGNEVDDLTRIVNKNAARFKAAGVPISQLTDLVVAASYEFSGEGLRGAISELAEEADKGLIPTVQTMNERIGEQTGYVEAAYQAGRTWRDSLGETKDSLSLRWSALLVMLWVRSAAWRLVWARSFIAFPAVLPLYRLRRAAKAMWVSHDRPSRARGCRGRCRRCRRVVFSAMRLLRAFGAVLAFRGSLGGQISPIYAGFVRLGPEVRGRNKRCSREVGRASRIIERLGQGDGGSRSRSCYLF